MRVHWASGVDLLGHSNGQCTGFDVYCVVLRFVHCGNGESPSRTASCVSVRSRPIRHLLGNRGGASMDREQGVVKWFDCPSGVGLIQPDKGGDDVIVYFSEVIGAGCTGLGHGQRVTFIRGVGRAARTATKLQLS